MEGLLLDPHMVRQKSSVVSLLIREIIPLMRAIPIWPNYLLKISPPNTTNTLGLGLQHIQFRRNTHIQSISFYLWPSQIYVLLTCRIYSSHSNNPKSLVVVSTQKSKSKISSKSDMGDTFILWQIALHCVNQHNETSYVLSKYGGDSGLG